MGSEMCIRDRSYSSPPPISRVCALGSLAVNSPLRFFTRFNFLGTSFFKVRVLPPHSYKGTYLSLARNNNCLFVYFGEPAGHKPNLPHTDASQSVERRAIRLSLQTTVHYSTELRTCAESNGGLKHRTCPVSVLYTAAKTLKPSLVFAIFHCLCCSGVLTYCIRAWDRMSYGVVLVFVSAETTLTVLAAHG